MLRYLKFDSNIKGPGVRSNRRMRLSDWKNAVVFMNVALVSIVRRHKEKQRALGKNVRQKYHGFGANIARFVNQTRSKTFSPSFVLFRNRRTNYKLIVGSF